MDPAEEGVDMSQPARHTLDVPGARLYFEVQGSGPPLMLVGHPMGCSGFATIAPLLAGDYTVVTYDPRGFGRSLIEDPDQEAEPDLIADDIRRVLEAADKVPAHVFGNSGGAVTGLALVARHPGHVETLIAHEPTLALLLPDPEKARSGVHEIYDTFLDMGVEAAGKRFSSFVAEMDMRPQQRHAEPQPPSARALAEAERVFGRGLVPVVLYEPDFSSLQTAATRVVVAGGTTSKGELSQCTAAALAERLGTPLIDFPGGHTGFVDEPEAFADVLRRTLA